MRAHGPEKAGEYYVLATGRGGEARLELLDAVYGPSTRKLLAGVGLLPGMSAADIGCGDGDVACWLAGRVGTTGTVVGVDIGADLAALFRAVGYPDPEVRSDQPAFRRGKSKRLWERTFLELVPALLEAGVTTAAEVAAPTPELARIGADETTTVAQARKTQVWARKTGA